MEVVLVIKNGWEEILEAAERMVIHLVKSLQESKKYQTLVTQASRLYPKSGTFKLGLNDQGGLPRVTFREAKTILRDLGVTTPEDDDFSCASNLTVFGIG
jgi:aspartyl/asparaginyl-tRNA synthetase